MTLSERIERSAVDSPTHCQRGDYYTCSSCQARWAREDSPTPTARDLWRAWYAMEEVKPAGTVGNPAYDAWTHECAMLYASARSAEATVSPFVARALAGTLPPKVLR